MPRIQTTTFDFHISPEYFSFGDVLAPQYATVVYEYNHTTRTGHVKKISFNPHTLVQMGRKDMMSLVKEIGLAVENNIRSDENYKPEEKAETDEVYENYKNSITY